MREAASLLRDRNFVKVRPIYPHALSMLPFGFFIGACILKWCENLVISGSAVPLCRILEKQNHLVTNAKDTEKT